MGRRLKEIDALRGLAVVFMIVFHACFDAMLLGYFQFEPYAFPWILLVRAGQFLFLGLVGVSIYLSSRGFAGQVRRALGLLVWAMVVTVATWFFAPQEYVRFGVLHCIAVSVPVVVLFKKKPWMALPVAGLAVGLGFWFAGLEVNFSWGIPFGLAPMNFATLDYFPLFPWLAVPLVGLWIGSVVYAKRQPTRLALLARVPGLPFLGRHALAVYLLHQPILYFSLWRLSYWIFT